ncbi:DEAD/DEAH box helicase [Entamoeba histolytica HM-3:IMSS]|uniref:DEAD/DEAH box helicase n=1 Tax=Entamoeba histolytica HM-3:IMSS TaxID=885315 RepID=M7W2Q6_ENTHI|nr:DEAD/DEAH box helicase [Entamoeba histolytica HM-3:IMSS]
MSENICLTLKERNKLKNAFQNKVVKGEQITGKEQTEIEKYIEKLQQNKGEYKYAFEETSDMKNFNESVPDMKRKYDFELDTFQKQAIYHMELGEHVFVIAHTSAGKTATAEYAISIAKSKGMKAIYTSPIKALSNQKYYDFRKIFGKVGIMTGDVVIQGEDDLVTIMTTEILRSKLYQDSKFIEQVDWVIFDEVHYVNDEERGVVWEEVIMSLPKHVKMLMLSATVENAINFAEWIGRTKDQRVCLVKTLYRPVPLEHYVFCKKKEELPSKLILFKKGENTFLLNNYTEAYQRIVPKFSKNRRVKDQLHGVNSIEELINYLEHDTKLPAVFFIFSRKLVMDYAKKLAKATKFDTNPYKINSLFKEMTEGLVETEKNLPQISEVKTLLMRGIGVHHAGLIPFLKEIVEVLFSQGDIKVLFATETFAMGVNMPAKSVIFPSVEKFDGKENRFLLPGEYTQMAGRAGRRGKDAAGNVIIFPNQVLPSPKQMQEISCGAPAKMISQFYITYWMMLNWVCFGGDSLTQQMMKSYSKIDLFEMAQRNNLAEEARKLLQHTTTICENHECDHDALNLIKKEVKDIKKEITREIIEAKFKGGNNFNINGRVIKFRAGNEKRYFGVIIEPLDNGSMVYYFDEKKGINEFILFSDMIAIYQKQFKAKGGNNYSEAILEIENNQRQALYDRLVGFKKNRGKEPFFQPYQSEKKRPKEYSSLIQQYNENIKIMKAMPAYSCVAYKYGEKEDKAQRQLEKMIDEITGKYKMNKERVDRELNLRLEVLKHFNFVDEHNLLTLKGKVAKEMVSSDGMILTNMMFDGVLNRLEIHEMAAIFSVFVFEPSNESQEELIDHFSYQTKSLMSLVDQYAMEIVDYEDSLNLEYNIEKYVKLNFGLMEGVALWALRKPFNEVIDSSATTEGLIVRCVLRMEQVCEEVIKAAQIIGNEELLNKTTQLLGLLKRDIINVKSLYLRDTAVVEGKTHVESFKTINVDTNDDLEVLCNENNGEIVLSDEDDVNEISFDDEDDVNEISFDDEDETSHTNNKISETTQPHNEGEIEIDF